MIWLPIIGNYTEIDAYASTIAYADLLNQRQKPAKTFMCHTPNYSVPDSLRLPDQENTVFDLQPSDQVIILDISIPDVIHQYVADEQILELIDHHPGHEAYWQDKLGDRAIIESIGAVATSVFEWWGKCWDYGKMSAPIAKLLLAAILDNTLDFNAKITAARDRSAADSLAEIAETTVPAFAQEYFSEVSKTVLSDLQSALLADTKILRLPSMDDEFAMGQLTVWDAASVLANLDDIRTAMGSQRPQWLLSILSLADKRNYIITDSPELKKYFTDLLSLKPHGDALVTDHLILRKEIMKLWAA